MKRSIVAIVSLTSPVCGRVRTVQGAYIIQQGGRSGEATGESTKDEDETADFLKLHAQSTALMDDSSDRVLYRKGQNIIRPMTSTTKIMTCVLASEIGNLEDSVTVSSTTASQPGVHLGARSGERYRLGDLLYVLMLESYNDAAVMIVGNMGGSVEGFVALMNEKAKSPGCESIYFITPDGLDGAKKNKDGIEHIHSTTASDLAAIMRYYAMQSPKRDEFLKVAQTQNYSFSDSSGKRFYDCYSHSAFLNMMQDALSGKTGFVGGAGYSYVGVMENGGRTYIIALLGCGWPPHKTYKWTDAGKLYAYGLSHYNIGSVFCEEEIPGIPVTGSLCQGEEGSCQEFTGASLHLSKEGKELSTLLKEDKQMQAATRIPFTLEAPMWKG